MIFIQNIWVNNIGSRGYLNLILSYNKLSRVQSKTITTFDFESSIWQVHAHATQPILLVETRNADTRTVQFAAVNTLKNEVLWNSLDLGDDWWRGLETMTNKYLVLHGFEDSHNPVSSGIYVFDLFTGNKIYANDHSTFIALAEDVLVEKLLVDNEERCTEINLVSGQQSIMAMPLAVPRDGEGHVLIPNYLETGEPNFDKIVAFIQRYQITEQIGSIEYLETNGHIAIAWVAQQADQLNQYLMLVDGTGHLLIQELIGENLKGKSPGAFLIAHDTIAFVKDRSKLWYCQL